jgi:hypothetical protein
MSKYLLTCACGNNLPVEIGQAGEQVACTCGAKLDVPPLRKLRHLPLATATSDRPLSAWNARRGIITACLILAIVPVLWAVWSRLNEPYIAPFNAQARRQMVDQDLETMTPVAAWQLWVERYRPMAEHGIQEMEHQHAAAVDEYVAKERFLQRTLLVVAGAFAVVAVLAAVWPQQKTGRQGDKETRRTR